MAMALLIALQAAAATAPIRYDVAAVVKPCTGGNEKDIVVCGSRDKTKYRIPPLPPAPSGFGTAERDIGGARAGVHVEQVDVGGFPSKRIMASVKIKL